MDDPSGVRSPGELLDAVSAFAATRPADGVVLGDKCLAAASRGTAASRGYVPPA